MYHKVSKIKLNRRQGHRKALLKNLVRSFLDAGQICSTRAKISACRPFAEKVITLIKNGDLASIRKLVSIFNDREYVKKVSDKLASMYKDRNGGYTRVIKAGVRRGDGAPISIIQLV
ncbi:MAG: 50S ribosomal protein L17 [Alphaproteobacteria bacterium]|nr:MAG: 50S ribosomal protein L17 [Alphaproteobacteria bacterium]